MELPKVAFDFPEFMRKHGLSSLTKPAFAKLLCVSTSSVQKWARAKKIPADYIEAIVLITNEDIQKLLHHKKWHEYDLRALRTALGISQTELAGRLASCQSSVSEWEQGGRIPYHRLPFVRKLEEQREQLRKQQECA